MFDFFFWVTTVALALFIMWLFIPLIGATITVIAYVTAALVILLILGLLLV